jgi:hypothetical protein
MGPPAREHVKDILNKKSTKNKNNSDIRCTYNTVLEVSGHHLHRENISSTHTAMAYIGWL